VKVGVGTYLGEALRAFRVERKLSSEAFADSLCISQSVYSKYENNVYPTPFQIIKSITISHRTLKIITAWRDELLKMEREVYEQFVIA
jgi:transcriptional regulator with XRE-family HTH domain